MVWHNLWPLWGNAIVGARLSRPGHGGTVSNQGWWPVRGSARHITQHHQGKGTTPCPIASLAAFYSSSSRWANRTKKMTHLACLRWYHEVKFSPWCHLRWTSRRATELMTSAVYTIRLLRSCPQRKACPLGTMRRLTSKSAPIQKVDLYTSNPFKARSCCSDGAGRMEIGLQ